ncbi:uncharacterized protein LOC131674186 [Phymastichus coffea]|uniref:uncharacterized protein LOC131674186 n=1 Tax=Phymastichus coffea TaxID=108790 RepID=UPI00273A841C|nr:uncharacterized protein LOC131674186 [Phymastichus coffea]
MTEVADNRDNHNNIATAVNGDGDLLSSSSEIPSSSMLDRKEVSAKATVNENEASHIGKTLALQIIGGADKENASHVNESEGRAVKVRNVEKTLRIGWLEKAAGGRAKYRRVAKPRGGVRKLQLDATARYSAGQIRRLAMEAFEASSNSGNNRAIEEEFVVNLGGFGGQPISDFKRRDGQVCDIWEYCKDRGKRLYQLDLFMLTSPAEEEHEEARSERRTISTRSSGLRPRIANDVRVLYLYVRQSAYTNELSYMECEKAELHGRLFEDSGGACPSIEHFEPFEHGFSISRIVKSGRVLLQLAVDDSGARSIEFPESRREHAVLRDVDQLQGHCDRQFGIGFVPSCDYACRPMFSWYRDGELFRSHEYLYWLDDVKDEQTHVWSCTVVCATTGRQIRSKRVAVEASCC